MTAEEAFVLAQKVKVMDTADIGMLLLETYSAGQTAGYEAMINVIKKHQS